MTRKSLSGVALRAPYLATYFQQGENEAYYSFANGSNVVVNAALKLLKWDYTPPVDVWAEVGITIGQVLKVDAAYHYASLALRCTPTPVIGNATMNGSIITQHSQVQQYEPRAISSLFGLAAGTAYTFDAYFNTNGGTWQFYQSAAYLWLSGKAWAR